MRTKNEGTLQRAVRWAAKQHRGQDREGKAPLPYITHPIDVMNRLRYTAEVIDEDILCAAALHDVVEECGTSFEKLQERFGSRVTGLVRELTRSEPSAEETSGMSEEQIADLRSSILLDEISKMSPEAQLVKLADRLSNLTSYMATRSGEKRERYLKQSEELLRIVSIEVSPPLWNGIKQILKDAAKISAPSWRVD